MDSAAVETVEGSVELSVVYQGVVHPGGEAVVEKEEPRGVVWAEAFPEVARSGEACAGAPTVAEATEERAVVDAAVATLEMEVD